MFYGKDAASCSRTASETARPRKFRCEDYHILIVDDNLVRKKAVCKMIAAYGIFVELADNGKSGICLAKKHKYDMIFMHHELPEMEGIEAVKIILPQPFEQTQLHAVLSQWIPESKKQYLEEKEDKNTLSDADLAGLFMSDIDVVSAARLQRSVDTYLELLDLFYTDGMKRMDLLKALIDNQDIENYVTEVHGLKSAAASIGANTLSKLAKQHEAAGKKPNFNYIQEHSEPLFTCYSKVLAEIKRVLEQQAYGQFAKKNTAGLPPITKQDMLTQIKDVFHQLTAFQSKEAAKGVADLLGYAIPDKVRSQLEEIQVLLKMYEDDNAEEMLKKLIQNL